MKQRGFTLLEMVVAIAVFAIMAVIAFRGLSGVLQAREALDEDSRRLARLQFAVALLERDIRQAVPRPVRDQFGDPQPALLGDRRVLAFSRLGWSNPAELPRASLERVEYVWQDGILRRLGWPVLDRAPSSEPTIQELLDGVESLRFRFLSADRQWLDRWPPASREDSPEWPDAVQMTLESVEFGTIERTFALVSEPAPMDTVAPFVAAPGGG